jgi:ATP-dependent Clp protease adaptor protein ClpS
MSDPLPRTRSTDPNLPASGTHANPKPHEKANARQLPPYKVLLHNDTVNEMGYVVRAIMELTHLGKPEATQRMLEAHNRGLALLLVTHKERAELYMEQFATKKLTVTIEQA